MHLKVLSVDQRYLQGIYDSCVQEPSQVPLLFRSQAEVSSPSHKWEHEAQQDQVIMQEPKAQPPLAQLLSTDQSHLCESEDVSAPAEEQHPFEFSD